MSRTHHARRPADPRVTDAPRVPDARKRALYSFKRIRGATAERHADPEPIPPPVK